MASSTRADCRRDGAERLQSDSIGAARGVRIQPWWVAPPHHVNYFDAQSIQRVLKPRFDIVSVDTSFPIDLFLLMGDNYVGPENDAMGRACHASARRWS